MNPHVEVEIEQVRRYLVENWQSFSKDSGCGWRTVRQIEYDKYKDNVNVWNTIPDRILDASPHLQGYDVPGEEIDRLKSEGLTLLEALERLGIA